MPHGSLVDELAPPPAAELDHPVRRLAEGIELLGRYENSGYETPKYLVRRADGQVMQLPELLYRLVESLDGRGAEEIAADLGARLEQDLTAEQVLYLVDERLRPVGLVAPDATGADDPGAAAPPVLSDPLLGLRYRAALVPERISWTIAGLFRPFFLRPVWIAAIAAFVALDVVILAQADLVGRLVAGVTSIIHHPQLSLVLLGLVLLSGAFHECGHVTACRFGGARPGPMGVGLYLVWPAFYSTVTDAYRLNRIGRLRTDLGGVYFNATFMSAASLAYFATGQNWLLVAVFAMHVETAQQFLPMLRFDGYYMLADLVGVPDLFAFVGPVFKRLLPGHRAQPRLAQLRSWARRMIFLWVAIAVPMILYYIVVILLVLPRLLPVVWRAVQQYGDVMQAAVAKGDLATATLGVFQLLLLLLPWVGSVLILTMFGRHARRILVSWGRTWLAPGRWSAARSYAVTAGLGVLGAALVLRVAQAAMSAPLSSTEARISASALGVLHVGRAAAPAVGPGEAVVRDQLVTYARLTGAFQRHADVLTGGRELAVLAVFVLVLCLVMAATVLRWRPIAVAVPLVAVTVMGPTVSALATLGPGVVGAAWLAVGATALVLAAHNHLRCCGRWALIAHQLLAVVGLVAVIMGIATAPLLAVPVSVVAVVVVVVQRAARPDSSGWTAFSLAAFAVTVLTSLATSELLRAPAGSLLSVPEQRLVAVTTVLAAAAALAVRQLRWVAVALGSLALVALLPRPGAAAVLPLAVCAAVALTVLALHSVVRRPPEQRPHPLVRGVFVVPAVLLVMVGTLFPPASAPRVPYQQLASWTSSAASSAPAVPLLRPQVLAEVPHDPAAFTEGLQLANGMLYESTGLAGRSQLREVDPETGAVRRSAPLPGQLFGEGVAVVSDRVWQLTWRDGVVLEWDRATLTLQRQLPLSGEGWGLCSDGTRLVRSDGTNVLHFHDPVTFAETGSVVVTMRGRPVNQLNELECAGGQVLANVFPSDQLVRIDPATGSVTAVVDAAGLLDPQQRVNLDAVLNGITALDDGEYLLTGKLWPVLFRVRFTAM